MANNHLDTLQRAAQDFNEKYNATREDIVKVLEAEEDDTPEAHRALAMIDALDAVIDRLVTYAEFLDRTAFLNDTK